MNHHSSLRSFGHRAASAFPAIPAFPLQALAAVVAVAALGVMAVAGARDGGDLPPCERVTSQEQRPILDAENGGTVKVRPGSVRMSAISIPPIDPPTPVTSPRLGRVTEAELPIDSRTMRAGHSNYHASMMNLF